MSLREAHNKQESLQLSHSDKFKLMFIDFMVFFFCRKLSQLVAQVVPVTALDDLPPQVLLDLADADRRAAADNLQL